jgi:hypothetical protein
VVALLPVLGAAAIRLAHAALGCVRIMEKKVVRTSGASWASDLLQVLALVFANVLQGYATPSLLLCRCWLVCIGRVV